MNSYSDKEWAAIEKELPSKLSDIKRGAIRRLLDKSRDDFLRKYVESGFDKRRATNSRNEWAKISKGAFELEKLYRNRCGDWPPYPSSSHVERLRKQINEVLFLLRVEADSYLARSRIDDGFPRASPKAWFHFDILHLWSSLGGELKISRYPPNHRLAGKVSGPLARYFSAVTQPVHCGSIETLPDVIDRHKKLWLPYMEAFAQAWEGDAANWAQAAMTRRELDRLKALKLVDGDHLWWPDVELSANVIGNPNAY